MSNTGTDQQAQPPRTRSTSEREYDLDVDFPEMKIYQPKDKLPTYKSVVGMIRYYTGKGGRGRSVERAGKEVAKLVYSKWYHDNIACVSLRTIERRIVDLQKTIKSGKKYYSRRDSETKERKIINDYKELFEMKDKLFDIYQNDAEARKAVEEEWGVSMTSSEYEYYEDQLTERRMYCSKGVDPVWYVATMRKQRLQERSEAYRKQRNEQFAFKSLKEISDILHDGNGSTATEESMNSDKDFATDEYAGEAGTSGVKRKLDATDIEDDSDPLPLKFRHLRLSERKVKEDVYRTVANMCGEGLSVHEAHSAVIEVGNGLFSRQWGMSNSNKDVLDKMPDKRSTREALQQIEAQSLSFMVDEMAQKKDDGSMVTHAIDSTTKKGAGKFAVQGIHIGQGIPFPLPIIPIAGETTEDIALQVDLGFEILAAVHGVSVEEIYKRVDAHMTDSTEHNKGFAVLLAELYDLDKPAGQIFCGTHTTLGFSSAMNKVLRRVESEMKLELLIQNFIVDLDVDTKNSSIAGHCVDICLKLVAPEYSHKPWNKNDAFVNYLRMNDAKNVLFAYKDSRFGCLSRASAVLLYVYEHLKEYLIENPHVDNRLACLVREVIELPYLKVVLVVFACLGVHIVEPFYARTIQKGATHSSLQEFYRLLHSSMGNAVGDIFYTFSAPQFEGVGENLFVSVKESYGADVLEAVTQVGEQHKEDVLILADLILPEMKTVLARQRRDYGIDNDTFPAEYPIMEQAANPDDLPVHNIGMENLCGKTGQRLHKLQTLAAVSRSIILQRCKELRSGDVPSFRNFKSAALAKRELELKWSAKMKDKFQTGADTARELALKEERKRMNLLESLKDIGGPFTDANMVED